MPGHARQFLRPGLAAGLFASAGSWAGLRLEPAAASHSFALLVAAGAVVLGTLFLARAGRRVARRAAGACLFLGAGLAAGLAAARSPEPDLLTRSAVAGEPVRFVGRLAQPVSRRLAPPRWRSQELQPRMTLVVDVARVERGGQWVQAPARVLLSADDVPVEAMVGDAVEGRARLRLLQSPANPGEPDQGAWLRRQGVGYAGSLERGALAVLGHADSFAHRAEAFRNDFAHAVAARLGDRDRAALVAALAVGERGGVGADLEEAFNASGLAHVLSISGLHLAVAVAALAWLLRRLAGLSASLSARVSPRRLAAALALPVTAFYVMLIGAPAPAVRAGLGLGLVLAARVAGRTADTFNTLGWALCAVVLFDPAALEQPSTQMSFLGVAGLAYLTPRLRELVPVPPPDLAAGGLRAFGGRLREGALLLALGSVAATLATAPLTALWFERASLVAAAANLVAWPASTVIVPAGALAAAAHAISPALAGPLVDLAGLCALALAECARFFAEWPAAAVHVAPPSATALLFYALLVFSAANLRRWLRPAGHLGAALGAAGLLAVALIPRGPPAGTLSVTFLSVGQGDSTVVRFPRGSTMVVDAGGDVANRWDPGARVVAPFLRDAGARRIDFLVGTHPHPDHVGGLPSLLQRFPVGELWVNDVDDDGAMHALARAAVEKGAAVTEFRRGLPPACPALPPLAEALPAVAALALGDPRCAGAPAVRDIDGVRVEVLHPLGGPVRAGFPELGDNDNSLVLRLALGRVRVLLPGDVEHDGEAVLLAGGRPLEAEIVKAPHHGSRTSSTPAFLDAVRPKHVVFCVGALNQWGFPAPEVVARYEGAGCTVHRTDVHGAVTFETDGERLEVRRFRGP